MLRYNVPCVPDVIQRGQHHPVLREGAHEIRVARAPQAVLGNQGQLGADAALPEYEGHGVKVPEKEVQGQEVCRWLLPGDHRPGRGASWLGTGRAVEAYPVRHAGGGGRHRAGGCRGVTPAAQKGTKSAGKGVDLFQI